MSNDRVTSINPELESGANDPDVRVQLETIPELSFLGENFEQAIQSFYQTVNQIIKDNPVDVESLQRLVIFASRQELDADQKKQLTTLKLAARKQGRAVAAVIGFFLKYNPYPMLAELRGNGPVFQPVFGPVMVVDNTLVLDVLSRHHEFTVDPYGTEMKKTMSYDYNGGQDTFILSTDDDSKFIEDKKLLAGVVRKEDVQQITPTIHEDSVRRVKVAVQAARKSGINQIDVVSDLARFVPVHLGQAYLGVPVARQPGRFDLSDTMLNYYGKGVVGPDGKSMLPTRLQRSDGTIVKLPDSALKREDGVIPDEKTMYWWIVSAFRNFFNNVEKDVGVQANGVRACRELLVYLLRELDIQRQALRECADEVMDTMLTRLLKMQMGLTPSRGIDPGRLNDLRIAENVMGTIVGAIAGQEEATCRVIDSIIRLKEGEYKPDSNYKLDAGQRYGSFEQARSLAINIMNGHDLDDSRRQLIEYVYEALRLQPQGEVLIRQCTKEGSIIGSSRPLAAGSLVFVAHGSAMQDVDQAGSFIVGRDPKSYLHYGYGRHKCLGQYVSPVIICEALAALLCLENIRRPESNPGETAFPFERRFGRFQLDDNNLYAKSFVLEYDHQGDTKIFYSLGRNNEKK